MSCQTSLAEVDSASSEAKLGASLSGAQMLLFQPNILIYLAYV